MEENGEIKVNVKRRVRFRLWVLIASFVFFFSLASIAFCQIIHWYNDGEDIKKLEDDLNNIVDIIEKPSEGIENEEENNNVIDKNEEEPQEQPQEEPEPNDYYTYIYTPFMQVDFTELLKRNSDTVGYIKVNNTNINYPVVKGSDNTYYLEHAFDKSSNGAGWIFLDYRNDLDNLSDNTIIYGHARLENTMFGTLRNALDKNWQQNNDNKMIRISTPKYNYVFEIFSVYTIQMESYYIRTTFYSETQKQEWIDTMVSRNTSSIKTSVSTNDYFLTLSTCNNNSGQRLVVQAKLVKKEAR